MNLLRDTLAARAERTEHVDVHGMLTAVYDLAERRASRRKTVYAASGASVGVAAIVAGSVALASGSGSGGRAQQTGGGPVAPGPISTAPRTLPPLPRTRRTCPPVSVAPSTAEGVPASLPPRGSCPSTAVPSAPGTQAPPLSSAPVAPPSSAPRSLPPRAFTSTLSILYDAPPAPADAPVSLGMLPKNWTYDGLDRSIPGQHAVGYGPAGEPAAIKVWAVGAGSYVAASANPSSVPTHGSYGGPVTLRVGDTPAHVLPDGTMLVLEVLRQTTLTDQDAQTILAHATVR